MTTSKNNRRHGRPQRTQHRPPQTTASARDIFLSHCSSAKAFVRRLTADIEVEVYHDRRLSAWFDEAEIGPGSSIPRVINEGLEKSRFIGVIMTPDYFNSQSGWTDAEWHAALHDDPDNRRGRIIPLLAADCPYIPLLLRHLRAIDLRAKRYRQGLRELLAVLRNEPLPRPIALRGQLIAPGARVDRTTLVAERAIPDADPDVVPEQLYCNLLPVERLPQTVYAAPLSRKGLKSKQDVKDAIRTVQEQAGTDIFVPAFRLVSNSIIAFHNLDVPDGPFASVINRRLLSAVPTESFVRTEENRKIATSLLHMAIDRHARQRGLVIDATKQGRYFFPPADGQARVVTWTPLRKKASRTVAKPCMIDDHVAFWRHLGVYLRMLFFANRFYLKVVPTWVLTDDGVAVRTGPRVGRLVIKWTGPERNLHLLYHVRFWATVLRIQPGSLSIRAGDQRVEIATVPATIQSAYGIIGDQRDLLGLLDRAAPAIAAKEDALADLAARSEASGDVPDDDGEIEAVSESETAGELDDDGSDDEA